MPHAYKICIECKDSKSKVAFGKKGLGWADTCMSCTAGNMAVMTIAEARAAGMTHFFTGKPCKNGHLVYRSVNKSGCPACNREWENRAQSKTPKKKKKKTHPREAYKGERAAKAEYSRAHMLKSKYGMTIEDYDTLAVLQGGVCAICEKPPGVRNLAVDHCHVTKVVRGLLCDSCNRGIGYFSDDPVKLKTAINYLKENLSGRHAN